MKMMNIKTSKVNSLLLQDNINQRKKMLEKSMKKGNEKF